jgi:hypothetical protein
LALFADRTSTELMRSNQLRLYFSTFAFQLMQGLRRLCLAGTEMAKRNVRRSGSRSVPLRVTVRRVALSLASGYPPQELFRRVHGNLVSTA